jgi:hypothetical protein
MSWHDNAARDPSVGPVCLTGREVGRAAGYSPLELERAGIDNVLALEMGLPRDPQRCTALGCNVMQLRQLLARHRSDSA